MTPAIVFITEGKQLNEITIALIASVITGVLSGLGFGGGGVLLLYLTLFKNTEQLKAQGINLLFFLPIGLLSIIIHICKKLIDVKASLPAICTGVAGVVGGFLLAGLIGGEWVRKIFSLALLLGGVKELYDAVMIKPKKKTDALHPNNEDIM